MFKIKQFSSRNSRRSFTFIEMLAAIALLEVVTVSGLTMFSFSNRTTAIIKESLIVTDLLQAKVEEIESQDFTKNVTAAGVHYSPYDNYLIDVTQVVPYLTNPYLKKITVKCSWTSCLGIAEHDSVVFLVAQY